MVSEFESFLAAESSKGDEAETNVKRNNALLVHVKAGIDNLLDKLETLKPVKFRAASNPTDKLTEAEERLKALLGELEQRKSEVEAAADDDAPLVLPANNNRVAPATTSEGAKKDEEEEDPDVDALSRDQVKRAAQIVVDANTQQPGAAGKSMKKKKK